MKKLTLKNILIVCMSICLLIGIFFAFDIDLTQTNNIADATETESETWNIIRTGYNFTIEYSMTGNSIYAQGNGKYYLVIWETGKGGSSNDPIFCGTEDSLVVKYSKTEKEVDIIHTLSGSSSKDYSKMDLSFGVFIYDSDTPSSMQKYETTPPTDWPKLYDTSLGSTTIFSKGFDFSSPVATSTNDTYSSSCEFIYKVNDKKVDKDEFFANANPSKEVSYSASGSTTIYYGTFKNAFDSIKSTGGTVTLLKDVTVGTQTIVGNSSNTVAHDFVLELNNHYVYCDINYTTSYGFNVQDNLEIKNSSRTGGIICGESVDSVLCNMFYIASETNHPISIKIQDGYYYAYNTLFKSSEYTVGSTNRRKVSINIESGKFETYMKKSAEATIFNLFDADNRSTNYKSLKDNDDITISGGEFSSGYSIFTFLPMSTNDQSTGNDYNLYDAGRKVTITAGNFTTAYQYGCIAKCTYHSRFIIGGSGSEPSKITFNYRSTFVVDKSLSNHKCNESGQETFKFLSCMLSNNSFVSYDSNNTKISFPDTAKNWMINLNDYKTSGFWRPYANKYLGTYDYVIFDNFKLDYRDGNAPVIVPTNDTLIEYAKLESTDYSEFYDTIFNLGLREVVNKNAPLQYFVCWSQNIDDEGFSRSESANGNLITKTHGTSSIKYEIADFTSSGAFVSGCRCFYAVWSTTNINECSDDVKYNENYVNIVPVFTQTLANYEPQDENSHGTLGQFYYAFDKTVLTINGNSTYLIIRNQNVIIDVREKTSSDAVCGIDLRSTIDGGLFKLYLEGSASLTIYCTNLATNGTKSTNVYGIYSNENEKLIFESNDDDKRVHKINIYTNDLSADNTNGKTYGIKADGTLALESTDLTLYGEENYSYTGIYVGKYEEDANSPYPYINNSILKINYTATANINEIKYIDAPSFGIKYNSSKNTSSQIICSITDPYKLNSGVVPYFDFSRALMSTYGMETFLYSMGMSPYVDNISTIKDGLNISISSCNTTFSGSPAISGLYSTSGQAGTTLYHKDLTKQITFSNVPKFSSISSSIKYFATLRSIVVSYDGTNNYSMLDDYYVEDSIYRYGTNHNFSLSLNGHNLYVNNSITLTASTMTIYGTGSINGGVTGSNCMFKGDKLGAVKVLSGINAADLSKPISICIYAGSSNLCDNNIQFYIGNEAVVEDSTMAGKLDIDVNSLTDNIHIMSGWLKYDISKTSMAEDGTYTTLLGEAGNPYIYGVLNYQTFKVGTNTYSSLNKAYKAIANEYKTNQNCVKQIDVQPGAVMTKDFYADSCNVTICLQDNIFDLKGYKISTAKTTTLTILGKSEWYYATIKSTNTMFNGNFNFKYCIIDLNSTSNYMFSGDQSNLVSLVSTDVKVSNKNTFCTYSLQVEIDGGFFDIKLESIANNIRVLNGYFINDISSYVQHLDGVLIYTNVSEAPKYASGTKYTCQFFSEETIEVYYATIKKTIAYRSITAALKAANEDNVETSYKFTLLSDNYMFSNYLSDNEKTYMLVTKDINIVPKDDSKKYNIYFGNFYLVVQNSLNITNAKIYANKFFYLNDEIGNVTVTLNNCEITQNNSALDSDCVFNSSLVTNSASLIKVVILNNSAINCTKGKFNLGLGDIDYQLLDSGTLYFNVNDYGKQVNVSSLTGDNKKIYYSKDASTDVLLPEDMNYLSIGATNQDYKNGLNSIYVYKTISNPLQIIKDTNYDISWYDVTKTSFTLSNAKQLLGLAAICNGYVYGLENEYFTDKEIHLNSNIDLAGIHWQPIMNFDGSFYGDNHSINNLTIDYLTMDVYYGLFGVFSGRYIKDLFVSGKFNISTYIDSYAELCVGGLIGLSQTTIINCGSSVEITFDCPKFNENTIITVGGLTGTSLTSGIYNSYYDSSITIETPINYENNAYIGMFIGVLSSSQIANCYSSKASNYSLCGETYESQIYNSYYASTSSHKFYVYTNSNDENGLLPFDTFVAATSVLDEAVYVFDYSELLDSTFELYFWDSKDGTPVFYNGPYFKLSVNGRIVKTCDQGFSYEPVKEGYSFEQWLRTNNVYTSFVPKNQTTGHYDETCFENRVCYYAYFQAWNEITSISIEDWTYGEDPNKPFATSLYGNVLYSYAVKDSSVFTSTVPTQAGSYVLKAYVNANIEYHGVEKTIEFKINKTKYNLSTITFTDKSYEYDGTEKTLQIYGFLPNGVIATYTSDGEGNTNKLTNVGKIKVTVTFSLPDPINYEAIPAMQAYLEVYKATIDLSSIRFEDTYRTYDESASSYEIKVIGTLPNGITGVIYTHGEGVVGNTLTNSDLDATHFGSLQVTATLQYNPNNYNSIDPLVATLYVNTYKSFDISFVKFVGVQKTYDKSPVSLAIDLDGKALPKGVTVEYKNNGQTNAGEYTVIAHFTAGTEIIENNKVVGYMIESERYNPINDLVAKIVIKKATHDVSVAVASFKDVSYIYDPNVTQELKIEENLPDGVTVSYSNNKIREVGSLLVVASFTVDEENYNPIDSIYATITITKAQYDMSGVVFKDGTFTYDGTLKTIKIDPSSVLPEGVTVKYSTKEAEYRQPSDILDEAGAVTVGSLYVYAVFSGDSKNYEDIPDVYATITITKAQYDMSNVYFKDATYVYDGKIHSIYVTDKDGNPAKLPNGVVAYYTTNTLGKAGSISVVATFEGDYINYEPINDRTATLRIDKATYNMNSISFNDAQYVFDNSSKTLEIIGTLPKGVTVSYKNNKGLQVGEYKATAMFKVDERNYNPISNMSAKLTITKASYDMRGIVFEDTALVYNGEYQTIYISGTLPEGVTVEYQHNSLKDACPELEAVATFKILDTLNYNVITPMRAKFVILKATYDMANVSFNNAEFIYDELEKKVVITGTLPDGVTVSYKDNAITNAGNITATAIFSGDYNNYNEIPSMTAVLTINKATYNMSYINFKDVSYLYDGNDKTLTIEQELPEGVKVEYSNNTIKNSGSLLVIATFSIVDEVNYNQIPSMSATITIEKLTYDMSAILFENKSYVYDGTEKRLEISGTLPFDVQVAYSYNKMVDVGVTTVTAAFRGDTVNHNSIPQMTATLTITKANYDLSGITFMDQKVLYDGKEHIIEISGALPKGVSVQYENNSKIEPGSYVVKAIVAGDTYNYYSKEYTATLTIQNTQLKNDESETKSIAVVYADEGFTKDVSLKTGFEKDSTKYDKYKDRDSKIIGCYSVTLYMEDETGNIVEYQPSECTVSGKIKVKLLLTGIDLREVKKIYHVHKDESVEEIAFDMSMFDGLYITIEVSSLSDFVFVAYDDTYKMTMIMNYSILAAIILIGLYILNTIFYFIWKKTGFALLKFMVPLYRFKNKLFFKIKFNDKEILDQSSNAGEKKDKKDSKKDDKKGGKKPDNKGGKKEAPKDKKKK